MFAPSSTGRWLLAAALLAGCKSGGGTSNAPNAAGGSGGGGSGGGAGDGAAGTSRAAVTAALAGCSLEVYRAFLPAAEALASATAALASAGEADVNARRGDAQAAWVQAIARWQEAELHQYGPLGAPPVSVGGKDLRDQIYAWPLGARCFLEQELVTQRYDNPNFASQTLPNVRGLGAAEYLLFYAGTDSECAPTVPIKADGRWEALAADPAELARRKRKYAAVVSAEVARKARELVEAWEPGKGDFLAQVSRAGMSGSVYASTQAVLNAQAWALMYLDNTTKDLKLARSLGLRDCASMPCPQLVESGFAGRSKDHLLRNLDGFEKLLLGCGGSAGALGMDDLLVAAGAGDLAGRLQQRVTAARTAVAAIPGDDLKTALAGNLPAVMTGYEAVKGICDLFKTELYSVLDIDLPAGVPMDND